MVGITGKLEMEEYVEEVAEDDVDIIVEEIVLVSFDEGLVEEVELQDGGEGKVSFDVVASEHKSGGKGQDFSEIEEVEKVFINLLGDVADKVVSFGVGQGGKQEVEVLVEVVTVFFLDLDSLSSFFKSCLNLLISSLVFLLAASRVSIFFSRL